MIGIEYRLLCGASRFLFSFVYASGEGQERQRFGTWNTDRDVPTAAMKGIITGITGHVVCVRAFAVHT